MKILSIKKMRLAQGTASVLLASAVTLTVSAILADSSPPPPPQVNPSPTPVQWPSPEAKRELVKQGFTNVLTLSARDKDLRKILLNFANQDEVRTVVQKEMKKVPGLENEDIPKVIIMIFYEPQKGDVHKEMPPATKDFLEADENRNFHVFYLPPYNPKDTATHSYDNHIRCCYRPW